MADSTQDVAGLLDASHRAHLLFRQHLPHKHGMGGGVLTTNAGDAAEAQRYLMDAATLRQQAHDADPSHVDPAWIAEADTFPHEAMMQFYADQLSKGTAH